MDCNGRIGGAYGPPERILLRETFSKRLLRVFLALTLCLCAGLANPAWALNDYGKVSFVTGGVEVERRDGGSYRPQVGDMLHEGDTLVTDAQGELHVTTVDHGVVALRPNTRVRIREYRAVGDAQDKSVLVLLRGTFRAVTGLIGRNYPSRYSIRTPTAAIGIRGTDHEPAYIPKPKAGQQAEGEPGTYDKVNEGETFIENQRGRVAVKPNQSGFAPLKAVAPVLLQAVPQFYRITDHENLIEEQANKLKEKLLEKPRELQRKAEEMKNKPREEGERRMREQLDRFKPRW